MSNQYRQLAEGAINLVVDRVKADIAAALDVVSAAAGSPKVQLENPKSYFIFEQPQAYECPAIFAIMDELDFKIEDRKSNFVNAQDRINVAVCVEDQDEERTTVKAWRYLSALHSVLDNTTMKTSDDKLVLKCVVYRARFSEIYTRKEANGPGGKFRKEMMLECSVTHLENF